MSAVDATHSPAHEGPATPGSGSGTADGGGQRRIGALRLAEASGLIVLTVALAVFFSILPATADTFPTVANLRVMVIGESVLVVVAMGILFPLVCKQYDFSVGATCGLSSIIVASVASSGSPLLVAMLAGIGCGLLVGLVNGLLVTVVRVDSVIVTLGMTTIITGVITWKTAGTSIVSGIPRSLTSVTDRVLGIPGSFFIALALAVVAWHVLRHTPFGRYLHAIGSNRSAARLVGLRVDRLTLCAFLIAGLLAGLAGILQVGVSGAGNPQVGDNFTLPAIAAAFLSVAAITPGRFNVWGTFVAIVFLAILNSGLNLAGASPYVNDFANGGALIAGVSLAAILARRRTADGA